MYFGQVYKEATISCNDILSASLNFTSKRQQGECPHYWALYIMMMTIYGVTSYISSLLLCNREFGTEASVNNNAFNEMSLYTSHHCFLFKEDMAQYIDTVVRHK